MAAKRIEEFLCFPVFTESVFPSQPFIRRPERYPAAVLLIRHRRRVIIGLWLKRTKPPASFPDITEKQTVSPNTAPRKAALKGP